MKKRKLRYGRIAIFIVLVLVCLFLLIKILGFLFNLISPKTEKSFLAADKSVVELYDEGKNKVEEVFRGIEVLSYPNSKKDGFIKIKYNKKDYYVKESSIVSKEQDVILNKNMYVRTMTTLKSSDTKIEGILKKGSTLKVLGFDSLVDGEPLNYKVSYNNLEGLVKAEYLVTTEEESLKNYDEEGIYKLHAKKSSTYGGKAGELDFYPRVKPKFEDNKMPEKVVALYLNGSAIRKVDDYINMAKNSNVNAFVVDIKDDYLSYESEVSKELSPSSYKTALSKTETYKNNIQKLKDNGYYVIGRITLFKDRSYALDNKDDSITDLSGNLYKHNGSYWPSAFSTDCWEYNVKMALEAVELFDFNEIQFDYVRFPDGTSSLEKEGTINIKNEYGISKIQAIQTFLMYATDILHEKNVYVSADVFGESAHEYVNSYGQYWGAISNVVDVISAMPYPDHFLAHQYGISEVVWTVPYKVLTEWCKFAMKRQKEIPTPAVVRTWIQAYSTSKEPKVTYDAEKIKEQIQALEDGGATGGYMTWSASSSMTKYEEIVGAL